MTVHVPAVPLHALDGVSHGEPSNVVRKRVSAAREMQQLRYAAVRASCNAHIPGRWLDARAGLASDARAMLIGAAERLGLSARGFHRVLRLARTIADLDAEDSTLKRHVAEALFFRAGEIPGRGAG
jgi:magnesium chelatase family protein